LKIINNHGIIEQMIFCLTVVGLFYFKHLGLNSRADESLDYSKSLISYFIKRNKSDDTTKKDRL